MASSFRANADGTTSVLNGSGIEVVKFPSTASANTNIATIGDIIGVGQTWQDVKASRAKDTTYTNTTNKAKEVSITAYLDCRTGYTLNITVQGVVISHFTAAGGVPAILDLPVTFLVPGGATYSVSGNIAIQTWYELS